MSQNYLLRGLFALGAFYGTTQAVSAQPLYPYQPVHIHMGFLSGFQIKTLPQPNPGAPWYAFFPSDPAMDALQHGGHTYPHWPTPMPMSQAGMYRYPQWPSLPPTRTTPPVLTPVTYPLLVFPVNYPNFGQ